MSRNVETAVPRIPDPSSVICIFCNDFRNRGVRCLTCGYRVEITFVQTLRIEFSYLQAWAWYCEYNELND